MILISDRFLGEATGMRSLGGTERNRMVLARQKKKRAASTVDKKGEAITELMLEVAQCFFRLRAFGQKNGLFTTWGGGAYGFLRSLALLGPMPMPQIGHMRTSGRQRMQHVDNALESDDRVV